MGREGWAPLCIPPLRLTATSARARGGRATLISKPHWKQGVAPCFFNSSAKQTGLLNEWGGAGSDAWSCPLAPSARVLGAREFSLRSLAPSCLLYLNRKHHAISPQDFREARDRACSGRKRLPEISRSLLEVLAVASASAAHWGVLMLLAVPRALPMYACR